MSDDKFRFNPSEFAKFNPNAPGSVLTASLEDIDDLAAYLKILYRSTAYIDDALRDRQGHFKSLDTVNEGGDNELVALALSKLNDIRDKVCQAHQSMREDS
jgi:hypothetical protein